MRLIGLLSWYDEQPAWLAAAVASLAKAQVDHLVAVDGAYRLYPEGKPRSPDGQAETIRETCRALDIGCTLHEPQQVWDGNEVEKRSRLFALAEVEAQPDVDWYLVVDSDEVLDRVPGDLKRRLAATDLDVGEVTFVEPPDPAIPPEVQRMVPQRNARFPVRILFRAIPGLRVDGAHYVYRTPDGRYLWGNAAVQRLEPAADCRDVEIDHRKHRRVAQRLDDAKTYYRLRDDHRVERLGCHRCGQPETQTIHTDWELHDGRSDRLAARAAPVCDECFPNVVADNEAWFRSRGLDPKMKMADLGAI